MKNCVITAPSRMTDETYALLCRAAEQKFGAAAFTRVTDDGLIGGFILEIDGTVYDLSVRAQLALLRERLSGREVGA